MGSYVIDEVNPDGQEPSEELLKDLKAAIRGEAVERKVKVGRFIADGNRLEFTMSPDEAGDEIVKALRDDAGLDVTMVKSRFESLAKKHFTQGKKTEA